MLKEQFELQVARGALIYAAEVYNTMTRKNSRNKKRGERHIQTVDTLATRLMESGKYDWIQKNMYYNNRGYEGEFDVFAYRSDRNMYIYFEVKSTHHNKAWKKANEQYQRAVKAFEGETMRGVYVTPQLVRRMR